MKPYGGTEIQLDYLKKYVPEGLLDSVQITTSVPEKDPLDPVRPNILWIKNSYDQPNLQGWFKNKDNHTKYVQHGKVRFNLKPKVWVDTIQKFTFWRLLL